MMKPMYYNDYYKRYNVQYERGKYNIVRTPCGSGVDNNKNLVKRLEQLATECEADKYTFVGNDGRTKISNILQLYTIYEKKGKQYRKQCKSVDAMNNVLLLRELPFRIEQCKERTNINGKRSWLTYYVVVDKRVNNVD